ncbi:Kinesin-like protein, partial [Globisporangium splendens]
MYSGAKAARTGTAERVKIFCRVRPLLQREREGWGYDEFCQQFGDDGDNDNNGNHCRKDQGPETTLVDEANSCFVTRKDRSTTQRAPWVRSSRSAATGKRSCIIRVRVYQQVGREIVHDVLDGFNGTIFAYGQTSTGKTHTMVGHGHGDQRGIVPRALQDIFARAEATLSSAETRVALSYVQIYCERIFDLLDPERPHYSIAIRAVASTETNAHSSRSHAILILWIERKESRRKSKVMGRHVNELKAINLSLTMSCPFVVLQLAEVEKQRQTLQEQMEADFVPGETIEQMEALYERAIAKLQERVGCLETKSISAGQPQLDRNAQRKPIPPSISVSNNNNQLPERANIGGPQKSSSRAIPKIGRLVPGSKAGSMLNGLR